MAKFSNKKVGVLLAGCGVYDGSEIHEACQAAPKLYHLRALQSVPPLIEKISIFSCLITGGLTNGKQVKDGKKRDTFYSIFPKLVQT